MKKLVKNILYNLGVTAVLHKLINRNTLTVLMLHRVLPQELITEYGANPEWSMKPEILDDFLMFLKFHYNLVTAKQIEECLYTKKSLPSRSLLITFDDGWRDNYQYACDILKNQRVPAIIFIVSNTVNQTLPFWPELVYSCCDSSKTNFDHCLKLAALDDNQNILDLLEKLENKPEQHNRQLVIEYCQKLKSDMPRQLISEEEIVKLYKSGIEIGSHGATHNQFGKMSLSKQLEELTLSKMRLEKIIKDKISYLSFPHGSSNDNTVELSEQAGYKLMFNSRVKLNKANGLKKMISRVHVSQESITEKGKFSAFKTSYRLFMVGQK